MCVVVVVVLVACLEKFKHEEEPQHTQEPEKKKLPTVSTTKKAPIERCDTNGLRDPITMKRGSNVRHGFNPAKFSIAQFSLTWICQICPIGSDAAQREIIRLQWALSYLSLPCEVGDINIHPISNPKRTKKSKNNNN